MSSGQNPAVASLESYKAEILDPIKGKITALWLAGYFLLLLMIPTGSFFLIESAWVPAIMTFVLGYASVIATLHLGVQLVRKADYSRVFAWRFKRGRLSVSIVLNALGLLLLLVACSQLQIVRQGTETAGIVGGLGFIFIIVGFSFGSVSLIGEDARVMNLQKMEKGT